SRQGRKGVGPVTSPPSGRPRFIERRAGRARYRALTTPTLDPPKTVALARPASRGGCAAGSDRRPAAAPIRRWATVASVPPSRPAAPPGRIRRLPGAPAGARPPRPPAGRATAATAPAAPRRERASPH